MMATSVSSRVPQRVHGAAHARDESFALRRVLPVSGVSVPS